MTTSRYPNINSSPFPMQDFTFGGLRLKSVGIAQADFVQEIYGHSPTYFRRVSGAEPLAGAAARDILDVPPNHGEHYFKIAALIYSADKAVGYVDLHINHRSLGMAYLGLLILREDVQGQGLGRRSYQLVENFLAQRLRIEKIFLGVSNRNQVQAYWEKMGFVPNGFTYNWTEQGIESVCTEMEKPLAPPKLRIERPSKPLYASFTKFVDDMRDGNQTLWAPYLPRDEESAEQFVERLRSRETAPAEGFVPETVYWAVYDGQMIGRISLRHRLEGNLHNIGGHVGYEVGPKWRKRGFATEMLRLVLGTGKAAEIGKLLLTCSPVNEASNKTIVRNGGVLVQKVFVEFIQEDRNHYWIEISSSLEAK